MGQNYTVKLDLVKAKHEHDAGECDSWCGWCYQESIEMEKLAHDSDIGAGEIEYEEIYQQMNQKEINNEQDTSRNRDNTL